MNGTLQKTALPHEVYRKVKGMVFIILGNQQR
jgi:hypothetical protein